MIFHFRSAAPAVHCGRGASIPASGIILAQFNRAPIPFLQIVMRNQASGRGSTAVATAFGSSLRSADTLLDLVTQVCALTPRTSRRLQPFPSA